MKDRFLPDLVRDEDYPLTLGRYTLTGLLGEGGMARVFRAELAGPRGFSKPVAVKIIRAAVAGNDENLKRALVHEARIGGMLHHPNLVEVYELGEMKGFPFITMELVEGVGLDVLVERIRPMPPGVVLDIAQQICRGLHHAHEFEAGGEADLVHRDLKPSNVLLSRNGTVKIADFGIAKAGDMTGNTTATGIAKGTPAYMSPQQANAEDVDRRSDIFALGAILYELFTGQRLFRGDTLVSTLMAVLRVEERLSTPSFDTILDGVLPGLANVVRPCLRHDPDDRYPTCEHLEAALAGLAASAPGAPKLSRWLASIGDDLEQSFDGTESPRARVAVRHLTAPMTPTVDDRTEEMPYVVIDETRPRTEPVDVSRRRRGPGFVAVGGTLVLLLGVLLLWSPWTGAEEDPALADLSMAIEPAPAVTPGPDVVAPAPTASPADAPPDSDVIDAAPAPAAPPARRAADPAPPPTPRAHATPAPRPSPEPTAAPPREAPEDPTPWEPEATPTPAPRKARASTAPPPSREALERAGRDRRPKRELVKQAAFRLTDPKSNHEKLGRKWRVTVDVSIRGSSRVDATLHLRAGSGKWRTYSMERTGSERWSATVTLPNTVDNDVQYWIAAENLAPHEGRVGRQETQLGSATRPQFHYLR